MRVRLYDESGRYIDETKVKSNYTNIGTVGTVISLNDNFYTIRSVTVCGTFDGNNIAKDHIRLEVTPIVPR